MKPSKINESVHDDRANSSSPHVSFGKRLNQLASGVVARWYWMVLALISGISGSCYYLSKAPEIYHATATLVRNPNLTESDHKDLALLLEQVRQQRFFTKIASNQSIIEQDNLIPSTINWLPAEPPVDASRLPPAELARMIETWTTVACRADTPFVDISVSHPVPKLAALIVNNIAFEIEKQTRLDKRHFDRPQDLSIYDDVRVALTELKEAEIVFSEVNRSYPAKHPKTNSTQAAVENKQKHFLKEFDLVRRSRIDEDYWKQNQNSWNQPGLSEATRLQIARRLLMTRVFLLMSENEAEHYRKDSILLVEFVSGVPKSPIPLQKGRVIATGSLTGLGSGFLLALLLAQFGNRAKI